MTWETLVHLDLTTWLVIAVGFLFLMVIALFLELHETKGALKLFGSLLRRQPPEVDSGVLGVVEGVGPVLSGPKDQGRDTDDPS